MLHGCVLRPPAFGAKLRSIDCKQARAIPGVTVVEAGGFVGVACADLMTAHQAIDSFVADWALIPQPSEAELESHLRSHPAEAQALEGPVHRGGGRHENRARDAAVELSAKYTTAFLAHVPIEPRAALASGGAIGSRSGRTPGAIHGARRSGGGVGNPRGARANHRPHFGDGSGGKPPRAGA